MPKLSFSTYSETRLNADVQRRVNVYPHSKRGFRQVPGTLELGAASTAVATVDTINLSAQMATLSTYWVSEDGSLLVGAGGAGAGNGFLFLYTMTTAFDFNTLTYSGKSFDLSVLPDLGAATAARAVDFSPDGSVLFAAIDGTVHVYALACSSPFDVSTAVYTAYVDLEAKGSIGTDEINGIWWRHGDEMWVSAATSTAKKVHRVVFAAGTDYTVNRTVTVTSSADLNGLTSAIFGLDLSASGTKLRALDAVGDVRTYTLSTAFDPATISAAASTFATTNSGCTGLNYRDGDSRFFIGTSSTRILTQYAVGGAGRGMLAMDGVLYAVIGGSLFSMDRFGTFTNLGTIANSPEQVGMATDGTRLVIAAGSSKYSYTVAAGLVSISDVDLLTAYTVSYLDQRFYFDQPGGEFVASEQNDPTQIAGFDFSEAESFDDEILATFVHNQLLYHFGETSTEVWYSSGTGRPPVDRQQVLQRGIAGRRAVDSNDNIIYFLDEDKRPNKMAGIQYEPIYTPALGEEFDRYTTVSDCIVSCYTWQQERFAEFAFPTADATWVYHENSGQWSKRESDGGMFRIAHYANAYSKLLGLDYSSGQVFEFSTAVYQDNAGNLTRTLDSELVTSELYEVQGEELIASCLNLTVTAQTGATTLSVSFCTNPGDDVSTFSTARSYTLAQGVNDCRFYRWGKFREGVFRITTTANDRIEIIDADLEVEVLDG